jgi:cellulose biosynthesis protein BcsQ
MYDRREGITSDVEEILREEFGQGVFETIIRINTRHKSAPSERMTIFEYEHSRRGRGTEDYTNLGEEVLQRLGYKTGAQGAAAAQ